MSDRNLYLENKATYRLQKDVSKEIFILYNGSPSKVMTLTT